MGRYTVLRLRRVRDVRDANHFPCLIVLYSAFYFLRDIALSSSIFLDVTHVLLNVFFYFFVAL